jgi:integrase
MAPQIRRGGYPTQAAAAAALEEHRERLLHPPETRPSSLSTGEWLRHWLSEKERVGAASAAGRKIAATTARGYRVHIENYLIPVIGDVPLSRLTPQDVSAVFASLTDGGTAPVRPLRPASVRRVYATLRSALNVAVKQQHLDRNPALLIHLDSGARPKALVWTAERVALWRETGKRPSPVMVWTPEQTGAFLDSATDDPLYALYHLVALRGLRRGEAVGLSWSDVDLESGVVLIREQVVQLGWRTQRTTPKAGSERMIALDTGTTQVLREHRHRQDSQLHDLGLPPRSIPYVFTRADGELVHPNFVTRHFADLIAAAQLPPIRLHDLRHGAAHWRSPPAPT